jgi:hypothetical protein
MKGIEIILDEEQIELANNLAHGRNDRKIGVVRNRRVDQSRGDLAINYSGVKAELAVGELFGVPINEETGLFGDGGEYDLIIGEKSTQVKFNNYEYGDLYFNDLLEFKAERAVLCIGNKREILVIGYISRNEFQAKHIVKDYGYGPRVAVEQHQLVDIKKLSYLFKDKYRPLIEALKKTNQLSLFG